MAGFGEKLKEFFSGAFDFKMKSVAVLNQEYEFELEEFMILCFSDMLGIDTPTNYYALELYLYLGEELERWQRNSNDRKTVWDQRSQSFDA